MVPRSGSGDQSVQSSPGPREAYYLKIHMPSCFIIYSTMRYCFSSIHFPSTPALTSSMEDCTAARSLTWRFGLGIMGSEDGSKPQLTPFYFGRYEVLRSMPWR